MSFPARSAYGKPAVELLPVLYWSGSCLSGWGLLRTTQDETLLQKAKRRTEQSGGEGGAIANKSVMDCTKIERFNWEEVGEKNGTMRRKKGMWLKCRRSRWTPPHLTSHQTLTQWQGQHSKSCLLIFPASCFSCVFPCKRSGHCCTMIKWMFILCGAQWSCSYNKCVKWLYNA